VIGRRRRQREFRRTGPPATRPPRTQRTPIVCMTRKHTNKPIGDYMMMNEFALTWRSLSPRTARTRNNNSGSRSRSPRLAQISLPWQHGSAPKHFAWFHSIGHPRKPTGRPKHLRSICHTSRFIGDFVQIFGSKFWALGT